MLAERDVSGGIGGMDIATKSEGRNMTLLELCNLMKKRWRLVIALPLGLAVIAGLCGLLFMPDKYTASTSVYVLAKGQGADGITSTDLSASQMITNDVAALVKSARVQDLAAREAGVDTLSGYAVRVESTTTTRIITISVTGTSPEKVALVANQLAATADSIAQEVMDVQSINVIDEARVPTSPSGPPRLTYVLIAFVTGLFLAIALIVIADLANTRVRSSEEAGELLGLPVIGRIPAIRG